MTKFSWQKSSQCAHQVRTDIKMDQWSAFGRAHFSWPQAGVFKCQYYVLTKPEPTSKWTNDLRLVARTSADPKQAFSNASIMCSPSQNPHQNGPMICVWSHALQLTPSRRFQMPVLCATRPETTQKWTNDLRLVAPTHAFHMPVHSSQLEFMNETSVHTQKLWNYGNF